MATSFLDDLTKIQQSNRLKVIKSGRVIKPDFQKSNQINKQILMSSYQKSNDGFSGSHNERFKNSRYFRSHQIEKSLKPISSQN